MARKKKEPIITVKTFFDGKQTAREVFMELILRDYQKSLAESQEKCYTTSHPNCGAHDDMEVTDED